MFLSHLGKILLACILRQSRFIQSFEFEHMLQRRQPHFCRLLSDRFFRLAAKGPTEEVARNPSRISEQRSDSIQDGFNLHEGQH